MPHVKFHSSPLKSGNNSGSCGALLNYLEKEDKGREDGNELNGFFNAKRDDLTNVEAKDVIEHQFYKKGLKADADKFYTVTMSFSQEELKGKSNRELTQFAQERFGQMYVNSIKGKALEPDQIQWVAKLETERKYKGDDDRVKSGERKSGEQKEGDQRHIHFVVARKTKDGKRQVSPMSNHFRKGANSGAVKSGFDQDHFKFDCEEKFDYDLNHERKKEDSVQYHLGGYRPDLSAKFDKSKIEKYKESKEELDALLQKFDFKLKENKEKSESLDTTISIWKTMREKVREVVVQPVKAVFDRLRSTSVKKSVEEIQQGSAVERIKKMEQQQQRDRTNRGKDNDKEIEL